jgi:MFS family permease
MQSDTEQELSPATPRLQRGFSVRLALNVLALGLLYLLGRMTANSTGVISIDLETALNLAATQTAALASGTYLAFGLAQIPGSMLLERVGPRRLLPIAGGALALLVYGFSIAPDYWTLLATRVAMGVALAPLLPGALAICVEVAGEERFSIISGVLVWLGRLGVVVATLPFAALIASVGWRDSFGWLAIACLLASAAVALVAAAGPNGQGGKPKPSLRFVEVLALLKTPGLIAAITFQGVNMAAVNAILGFWGAQWLANVYDMKLSERSTALLALALSWAVGALFWGEVPRIFSRSLTPILGGGLVAALCLVAAAVLPLEGVWSPSWFILLGLATASYPAVLHGVKASAPTAAIVHTVALVSTGSMIGVFVGQMASGLILDTFPGSPGHRPAEAYSTLFAVFALAMLLSALWFWRAESSLTKASER